MRIWSLGPDPELMGDPSKSGDILGRSFYYPGLGFIGHTGIWDGQSVVEAIEGVGIRKASLASFKAVSTFWGTTRTAIPDGNLTIYCYDTWCPSGRTYPSLPAREGIAKRLNQVYLIGADYTFGAYYKSTLFGDPQRYPVRGLYRRDTLILDTYRYMSSYATWSSSAQRDLQIRWYRYVWDGTAITPVLLINRMSDFK
jgi:hypothetical protein